VAQRYHGGGWAVARPPGHTARAQNARGLIRASDSAARKPASTRALWPGGRASTPDLNPTEQPGEGADDRALRPQRLARAMRSADMAL
jgi:hypothetical protein